MPETFSFIPDNSIPQNIEFNTLVSEFENGAEQRRSKRDNSKIGWTLSFILRPKTEMESFKNFFNARKGKLESFYWTNPDDNTTRLVRFDEDKLEIKRLRYDLYSYSVKIIEVIQWEQ